MIKSEMGEIITCNANKSEFTYKELYEKFLVACPFIKVTDYRPYSLCENSIIIWTSEISDISLSHYEEIAFRYDPKNDTFIQILDAKSHEEILMDRVLHIMMGQMNYNTNN